MSNFKYETQYIDINDTTIVSAIEYLSIIKENLIKDKIDINTTNLEFNDYNGYFILTYKIPKTQKELEKEKQLRKKVKEKNKKSKEKEKASRQKLYEKLKKEFE